MRADGARLLIALTFEWVVVVGGSPSTAALVHPARQRMIYGWEGTCGAQKQTRVLAVTRRGLDADKTLRYGVTACFISIIFSACSQLRTQTIDRCCLHSITVAG